MRRHVGSDFLFVRCLCRLENKAFISIIYFVQKHFFAHFKFPLIVQICNVNVPILKYSPPEVPTISIKTQLMNNS